MRNRKTNLTIILIMINSMNENRSNGPNYNYTPMSIHIKIFITDTILKVTYGH